MDLIAKIRRDNGVDSEMRLRAGPEIEATLDAMRDNLERALQCLSHDLYSKPTHFLLELIQNADDNNYLASVTPELSIKLGSYYISVHCNEEGFTEENVKAICKIGASTKKNCQGYIGEKGIGFKSVFKVADVVYISSGEFMFKFDVGEELGMITPTWTNDFPVRPGWTIFNLRLRSRGAKDRRELAAHLNDLQPSLLLFLRKLRAITIGEMNQPGCSFRRRDISPDIIALDRLGTNPSSSKYLVVKHLTSTDSTEKKRIGITESEIVLAFPISEDEKPIIYDQPVHAFLPLRSYGFSFIIQADFLTSASREDILSDLPWNCLLREGIRDAFLKAVAEFQARPSLKYCWFRYLENYVTDDFFHPVQTSIIANLCRQYIFHSGDGIWQLPFNVIIPTSPFLDHENRPLIPEMYLPGSIRYLSPEYDMLEDGDHFKRLGVREMSTAEFLAGLQNMSDLFPSQTEDWHERVCETLYDRLLHERRMIMQLPILPLQDDTWVSASSGNILFDFKVTGVPQDLGLRLLKVFKPLSWRYKLFEALWVKQADPPEVARVILNLHRSAKLQKSIHNGRTAQSFLSHAWFIFIHRNDYGSPRALEGLQVVDEHGRIAPPTEVYMDHPADHMKFQLRDFLQPPARFLHPLYMGTSDDSLGSAWWDWLRDDLHVNVSPRVGVNTGSLSKEFSNFLRINEIYTVLNVLRERWPQLQSSSSGCEAVVSQLSGRMVICENKTEQKINATFLKRKNLREFSDLHFLAVDDPDHHSWDFLDYFGVTLKVDGIFYLKRLIRLKEEDSKDRHAIEGLYKQLEARFDDDDNARHIRTAFTQNSLVFVLSDENLAERWTAAPNIVWGGPASMHSKIAIDRSYPTLEKFFRQLGITAPPDDILLEEIRPLATAWRKKTIPAQVQSRIFDILSDVSTLVENPPQSQSLQWLRTLSEMAIFPVDSPSKGLTLYALSDLFYIPDKSGKLKDMFTGDVAFLALPRGISSLFDIQFILESEFFKPDIRYLDNSITRVTRPRGSRISAPVIEQRYASRVPYIGRLIRASFSTKNSLLVLPNVLNITVFQVDSIESTFTLEYSIKSTAEYLTIENDPTRGLSVLISKACPSEQYNQLFCNKLAEILDVEESRLLVVVCLPIPTVEAYLADQGIPDVAIDEHEHSKLVDSQSNDSSKSLDALPVPEEPATSQHLHSPSPPRESLFAEQEKDKASAPGVISRPLDLPTGQHIRQPSSSRNRSLVEQDRTLAPKTSSERSLGSSIDQRLHMPSLKKDTSLVERGRILAPTRNDALGQSISPSNTRAAYPTEGAQSAAFDDKFAQCWSLDGEYAKGHLGGYSEGGTEENVRRGSGSYDEGIVIDAEGHSTRGYSEGLEHGAKDTVGNGEEYHGGSTPEDDYIGIMGELYVFHRFKAILPGFTSDYWTSELRGKVPNFTEYQGTSIADFAYPDVEGALTRHIFGEAKHRAWLNQWPVFYLEVKTTSGAWNYPFHVSRQQLELASQFTMRDPDCTPKAVYVIVRVSNIRTPSPSLAMYVDPHRMLFDGKIQIISDVDMVARPVLTTASEN